jgi:hypothetical protein
MKDEMKQPPATGRGQADASVWTLEEAWENCTGQCGADPWCGVCLREKERLHKEGLNRERESVDK